MPAPTLRYATLRHTKTVIRVLAPIVSSVLLFVGLTLFVGNVLERLLAPGYGMRERMIWGAIGLGYLMGFPLAGFVVFFLFRAATDLIDLWIDSEVSAEKTADLMERQLVPGVNRMCQLLEKTNESLAGLAAGRADPAASSAQVRQQAIEAVREAVRREAWDQARQLLTAFAEKFPDAPEAKDLAAQLESSRGRKVQALRTQLDEAQQAGDAERTLTARDRLSAYLDGNDLEQLDRRVAGWLTRYIRDRLAAGRARDVLPLAERVVDTFGDTTEGSMVRAALPTLRRSSGLCPDCGQPYDVSLERCPACQAKRAARAQKPDVPAREGQNLARASGVAQA
jgi:hypothetical protein